MTYQIISQVPGTRKKDRQYSVWIEFVLTTDKAACRKLIDMLDYFRKSMTEKGFATLMIREIETGKCFRLLDVETIIRKKLSSIIDPA